MRVSKFLGLLPILIASPVWGNDSAAELAAGGIILVRSDGIAMVEEDLAISLDEVRVTYLFRNETPAPITTRVAFPVPQWDEDDEGDLELDRTSKNPMNFSLTINGQATTFETEVRKAGTKVNVTHHWTQTFPPGQDVKVEHRYRPVAGGFFSPEERYPSAALDKELTQAFCVGPTLLASLKRNPAYLRTVGYILKSGANWRGPIRRFRLTLTKAKPRDKISVCLPDTRKVSPSQFVVDRTNFTPTADLRVLFIPAEK
jgi:hypothetical protein